jgi:hypothetical protein
MCIRQQQLQGWLLGEMLFIGHRRATQWSPCCLFAVGLLTSMLGTLVCNLAPHSARVNRTPPSPFQCMQGASHNCVLVSYFATIRQLPPQVCWRVCWHLPAGVRTHHPGPKHPRQRILRHWRPPVSCFRPHQLHLGPQGTRCIGRHGL